MNTLPRQVHPAAWWVWALALATAASMTANPVLLLLLLAVTTLVVVARRGSSPWSRAYRLYAVLGAVIVGWRLLLHVLVGLKQGRILLVSLPAPTMPSWAAGITLGGDVYLEGMLAAGCEGLRLAAVIIGIGAANALANPKRLLRSVPGALHEIGTAVVVSITVAPQLAESVQRVMRARRLRGDDSRGLRAVRQVALPVLQDTLDRSLLLAAAMDARGYGRRRPTRAGRWAGALGLLGLLGVCWGVYGLLDPTAGGGLGPAALAVGLICGVGGIWLGGQGVARSVYRPDPWRAPETGTALSGLVALASVAWTSGVLPRMLAGASWLGIPSSWATHAPGSNPGAMTLPLQPLALPELPWLTAAGVLVAALPAVLTPPPPATPDRHTTRPPETPTAEMTS